MHTDIGSRIGALELDDARLEAAAIGPVQTHRYGCTMLADAILEDTRTTGPTTGVHCTPTLSAVMCRFIDDAALEATTPLLAGPTRGGCFMSNPPQCRPSPGSLD